MCKCTNEAAFGVLCHVHARQIAGTPAGFQFNRIKRTHLPNLTGEQIDEAIREFKEDKGDCKHLPRNPLSFIEEVFEFIESSGEAGRVAGEIVSFVHGLVNSNRMTSAQVGSILGTLSKQERVVRKLVSVDRGDGRYNGSAVYVAC